MSLVVAVMWRWCGVVDCRCDVVAHRCCVVGRRCSVPPRGDASVVPRDVVIPLNYII
ncbi:hypothetical protein GLYMA_17G059166v4 [Glycine max]|nr:hypothetical protein GLYMA_17G059166v4 [Glycine max]KAH1117008.1 hypothetical protein GYH30_046393 [Glycine max]